MGDRAMGIGSEIDIPNSSPRHISAYGEEENEFGQGEQNGDCAYKTADPIGYFPSKKVNKRQNKRYDGDMHPNSDDNKHRPCFIR
jgi:hypothetical protein